MTRPKEITTTINKVVYFRPTLKQSQAWKILKHPDITEVLFGGGAGGGKTYLGCSFVLKCAIAYPGSRGFLGRSVLSNLKKSTLLTFFDVMKEWGLKKERDYHYNQVDNYIRFSNGTEIYLLDLDYYPGDPEYDRLGSMEFTYGFVDECNQIRYRCFEVLTARMRYKLNKFKIKGKIVMSCNPAKNWVYTEWYKPWKEGKLEAYRSFVQALAKDNPHNPPSYLASLHNIKDRVLRLRLEQGEWEYEDDVNSLYSIDDLNDLFSNTIAESKERYLICDAARMGRDKAVIMIWEGLRCIHIEVYPKTKTNELEDKITAARERFKVPLSHTIVDEDGVGGGIVDHLGCKGFLGGSSPIEDKQKKLNAQARNERYIINYLNLRAQCYFLLADYVREHKIAITTQNTEFKQLIIEDLEVIKAKDVDKDGKLKIISKEDIKDSLGRSPDFGDTIMMRMYFELNPQKEVNIRYI